MKKGQVSVEFLIVFGFVFLMTIPLIMVFFDQSGVVKDAISSNHLRNIGLKIIDKAETVYYLGVPSKTTLKTQFPENLEFINITSRAIIFGYRSSKNIVQPVVVLGRVNLTGSLSTSPGIHYIMIESVGDSASITES